MSETSYEQCHISYRGYMDKEIDTAREVLRKYGKPCVDAVKELRGETDMPMSECADMLRCLRRDAEIEHVQAENAKLRELVRDAWGDGHPDRSCEGCDIRDECHDDVERMRKDGVLRFSRCLFELRIEERMRELGIEVTA